MKNHNSERVFRWEYKIAAVILTPLLIAAFLSIISLRATIYQRAKNFDFRQVLTKTVKIFTHDSIHKETWATRAKMTLIESAIDTYFLNTGKYPRNLNDLIVNPGLPGWTGPYLKPSQVFDPWGNPYIYSPNSKNYPGSYEIISYDTDGQTGGDGENEDIYND